MFQKSVEFLMIPDICKFEKLNIFKLSNFAHVNSSSGVLEEQLCWWSITVRSTL